MSSLTISLLILAVAAIAAVVAVNLFQAMGRRKRLLASRPKSDGAGDGPGNAAGNAPGAEAALGDETGTVAPGTAPPGATASGAIGGLRVGSPRAGPRLPSRTRQEPRLGDVDGNGEEPDRPMPGAMSDEASSAGYGQAGAQGQSPGYGQAPAYGRAAGYGPASGYGQADPGFGSAAGAVAGASHAPGGGTFAGPAGAGGEVRSSHLSPLCDCIVTLELDPPVGGERLLALTQGVRRAGAKPILVEGLPAGSRDQESVSLSPANAYRALRLGVLLANRHGPLNAMEYSDFVAAVQGVADALSALADTPDMADAIARARDLDATCAQLDAQIGLNVDSPEPLGPSQIAALAGRVGLVDRGGHRHARLGPNGEIVFTMSFGESPQRLGFLLDVPRTPQSLDGWSAMLDCAHQVATTLSGKVVDDNGRPIPNDALATIARQLAQRYDSLEAIGLPAGSPLAMRVFN